MSKVNGVKCDICDRIIKNEISLYSEDPKHFFFPIKFRLVYGFEEDSGRRPQHMCYDCFELFKKFVKEVNKRKKEKETTSNGE